MAKETKNYIAGEFLSAANEESYQTINPATELPYFTAPNSDVMDLVKAIQAVAGQNQKWPKVPLEKRVASLQKLILGIEANREVFEKLLSLHLGYPTWAAKQEYDEALNAAKYYCEKALKNQDKLNPPRGLVAVVLAENSPLFYFMAVVFPGILLGNHMILHPSPQGAAIFDVLLKIYSKLDLPGEVLQVLYGNRFDLVESLSSHPAIKGIFAFCGAETGKKIRAAVMENNAYLHLEVGGRNSLILGREVNFNVFGNLLKRVLFSSHYMADFRASRVFIPDKSWDEIVEDLRQVAKEAGKDKFTGVQSYQRNLF